MNNSVPFHPARILCPVDFSGLLDLALKYAAAGARVFDATPVVLGAHRRSSLQHGLGDRTELALRHARAPMLVAPR